MSEGNFKLLRNVLNHNNMRFNYNENFPFNPLLHLSRQAQFNHNYNIININCLLEKFSFSKYILLRLRYYHGIAIEGLADGVEIWGGRSEGIFFSCVIMRQWHIWDCNVGMYLAVWKAFRKCKCLLVMMGKCPSWTSSSPFGSFKENGNVGCLQKRYPRTYHLILVGNLCAAKGNHSTSVWVNIRVERKSANGLEPDTGR